MVKTFLVTGGAGFIGSAVIRQLIASSDHVVVNVDKLTYAGNLDSLADVHGNPRYHFVQGDICDAEAMQSTLERFQPDIVMHLAAESHVDRSIDGPAAFIQTNVVGTTVLLEAARSYWQTLQATHSSKAQNFRFHHISTDEVFGDLTDTTERFTEVSPYAPNSPYSASKASSDHLVRAWHRTFDLPTLISNCSNNFGPYQFPEKLIPLMMLNAMAGKTLPVYGDGLQVRDWLYVEDHARALITVATEGQIGETYNIGGDNERTNLAMVETLCVLLDERLGTSHISPHVKHSDLITFVADRPGHDVRYAIDSGKIKKELGWVPEVTLHEGLARTVDWYLGHREWWQRILDGRYRMERQGIIA